MDQTSPEIWDQPSNLKDWSLRDLVGHATESSAKIVTLVAGGEVWSGPSQPADWVFEDPAARLRELAGRLQGTLPGTDLDAMRASPEGEVLLRRALTYPISDLALHSWDVHRSQGRLVELPEDILALCPSACGFSAGGHAAAPGRLRAGAICAKGLDTHCPAHGPSRALSRRPGPRSGYQLTIATTESLRDEYRSASLLWK